MTDAERLAAAFARSPDPYTDADVFGLTCKQRLAIDKAILALLPVAPAFLPTAEIDAVVVRVLGRPLSRGRGHLTEASQAVQVRMALLGLTVMVDPGGWSRPSDEYPSPHAPHPSVAERSSARPRDASDESSYQTRGMADGYSDRHRIGAEESS